MWDLEHNKVYLTDEKKHKYLSAIRIWRQRDAHVLIDVQQLYGKLLHTTLVVPKGRAYLTSLEAMLRLTFINPFLPRRPVKTLEADLIWWIAVLQSSFVGRSIPKPLTLHDPAAYSDASSGIGIAIIIGDRWRAWRLRKGWQTLNGQKDIGWAEAVGFELLIIHIVGMGGLERNFWVYRDNQGIIEGWRNGRSRNKAINSVLKQIFDLIYDSDTPYSFHPTYATSKDNPADEPSRGIYSSTEFLLPFIPIPHELQSFIFDPFVAATNSTNHSADVSENIASHHSNESYSDDFGSSYDSLFLIRQEQQRHYQ